MKILSVCNSDIASGAPQATYRLHKALLDAGTESQMLVQFKSSDDFTVIGPITRIQKMIGRLRIHLDPLPVYLYKDRKKQLFSPSWVPFSTIVNRINTISPDLVHLHWINGGMMRIEDIVKIKAPIVWSLHDNWGFTGGCHVMWECEKYKDACGACPRLGSSKENDLSRSIFNRKRKTFSKLKNMTVIGLSNWLANCAKESSLFKNNHVICLPNPINTKNFAPLDKIESRKLFNLPEDKKLVLFGAQSATTDINKGFNKLTEALKNINTQNVELLVFGSSQPKQTQNFKQPVNYLGYLHDNLSLRALYSAADVMVVPSIQEAFGQTASESMACGTPVVAFGATGLLDIVDHRVNGYLAKPFDTNDLAQGIDWVLNAENYSELCKNAQDKVLKEFDSEVVAKKYIALYEKILKN
jgi:glycosyltransferase involved in cell wall biosynthesis